MAAPRTPVRESAARSLPLRVQYSPRAPVQSSPALLPDRAARFVSELRPRDDRAPSERAFPDPAIRENHPATPFGCHPYLLLRSALPPVPAVSREAKDHA